MPEAGFLESRRHWECLKLGIVARYSFVGAALGALGALASGAMDWLAPLIARDRHRGFFTLCGAFGLGSYFLCRGLSPRAETVGDVQARSSFSPSRRRVLGLAALFALDAFGGGLVVSALVALWLFQRFGLDVATTGTIFFVTGLCSAASYFAAVPLARRFAW